MECHMGFDHQHASRVSQPRQGRLESKTHKVGILSVCLAVFWAGSANQQGRPSRRMEQIGLWSKICSNVWKMGFDPCIWAVIGFAVVGMCFFPCDESFFPEFCWEISFIYFFPFEGLKLTTKNSAGFISHRWVRFRSRQRTPNRARVQFSSLDLFLLVVFLRILPW